MAVAEEWPKDITEVLSELRGAVSLATVLDKWVGETEKYIEALFTLARKIAPVIIFC